MSQATSFTTTPGITDALRSSVQNSIILPPNFAIPMTHVPVHVITPVSELVHKIAALAFAITLTLGTYAIVNPKFGEYAAGSLRSAGHSIADTYTTTSNDFAMAMLDGQQTLAYAATDPKAFAASASDAVVFSIPNSIARFAQLLNTSIDSALYTVLFPQQLNSNTSTTGRLASGTAPSATVVSHVSSNASTVPASSAPVTQTIIQQPVIERIIQTPSVFSGVSQQSLTDQLQQLDNKLSSRMYGLSSANATTIAQNYNVTAQSNAINQLSNTTITNPTIIGGSISGVTIASSGLTGTVSVNNGGTGTSTAPAYGQLLLGNAAGGYDLVATSSLGIISGVALTDANVWSALQIFAGGASSTDYSNVGTAYVGGSATTTIDEAGNVAVGGTFSGAGLSACSGSTDKLLWDSVTKQFSCGVDAGAGSGISGLRGQYSPYQNGAGQTFATTTDANIGLTITSAGDIHTFSPTWTGSLAVNRGGTGTSTAPAYGQLLLGNATGGYDLVATSSLGINTVTTWGSVTGTLSDQTDLQNALNAKLSLTNWYATTTSALAEGTNLYYTAARFNSAFAGKSTTDLLEGSNLYFTTNRVASVIAGTTTTALAEGSNLYFTNIRADARVAAGIAGTTTDALAQGSTNKYYSDTFVNTLINASTTMVKSAVPAYGKVLVGNSSGGFTLTSTSSLGILGGGGGSSIWGSFTGTLSDQTDLQAALDAKLSLTNWYATTTTALAEGSNLYFTNSRVNDVINASTTIVKASGTPTYGKVLVGNAAGGFTLMATSTLGLSGGGGGSSVWGSFTGTLSDQTDLQAALDAKLSLTNWYATTTDALHEGSTNLYFTTNRVASVLAATTTTALAEGTNKYYTDPRVQTYLDTLNKGYFFATTSASYFLSQNQGNAFSTTSADTYLASKSTSDLLEGSNLYFTPNRVATVLAGTTTDALAQGSTNKYYATNLFASDLAATTTTALAEGSNLYWTNIRFDNRLSATTTLPNLTTLANLASVGTITSGTWSGLFGAVSGANLTNLTAANISAGTAGIDISGNAGTATKLFATKNINGVAFDGSADITISAASSTLLANNNTFSGSNIFSAGLLSLASTSIGNGTQTGGLTIFGGATTTGNAYFGGNVSIGASGGGMFPILFDAQKDQNNGTIARVRNDTNNTSASAQFIASVGDYSQYVGLGTFPSSYTTNGLLAPNSTALYSSGATNGLRILSFDSAPLTLGTNNTARMTIDTNGNVGIGTTTPWKMFSVAGDIIGTNINATGTLAVSGNTTLANATTTNLFSTTASSTNLFSQNASFGSLTFSNTLGVSSGGTGVSTLTGVAIGNGTSAFTAGTTQTCTNQFVRSMSASYVATCASVNLASDVTGTLAVSNGGTGITSLGTGIATWWGTPSSANLAAALTDETGSGSVVFSASPTLTGTLTAAAANFSGNVGVGTTTSWAKLSVTTAAQQSGSLSLFSVASTTGASLFNILGNGNTGIGTSTPWALLSLAQSGSASASTTPQFVSWITGSSSPSFIIGSANQNGNVGIGTTSPAQTLSVVGKVYATGGIQFGDGTRQTTAASASADTVVRLSAVHTYTSGTNVAYVPAAGASYLVVEMWGGGAGGGTVYHYTGAYLSGGSGGGGGYSSKFIAPALGGTYYYSVGAGGAGGTGYIGGTSGHAGAAGGSSCFGTNATACTSPSVSATGGGGGTAAISGVSGGAGGTGSGDVNLSGSAGGVGVAGGSAPREGGASGVGGSAGTLSTSGGNGSVYGGGGGAGYGYDDGSSSWATNGGNGAAGFIVVYEYSTVTSGTDLAENYPVNDPSISAGDIVSVDTAAPVTIGRAVAGDNHPLVGVISTQPGLLLTASSTDATGERPVALSGRVPTKVNMENGPVAIGDRIALSSVPGVGRKATPFEDSVGIALEPVTQDGMVTVFMNLQRGINIDAIAFGLLNVEIPSLSTTTSATSTPSAVSPFLQSLFKIVTAWFADATNGIEDFFAGTVHTKELCVGDASGETCLTRTQLDSLLAGAAAGTGLPGQGGVSSPAGGGDSSGSATSTTPIISISGNNPATIDVGSMYSDLGAIITGPTTADTNLGIHLFVDGVPMDVALIDTATASTHTIDYVATNSFGTATSTRTIIIDPVAGSISTPDASSTPSTDPLPADPQP